MNLMEVVHLCDSTNKRFRHPEMRDPYYLTAFGPYIKAYSSNEFSRGYWEPTAKEILRDDYEVVDE